MVNSTLTPSKGRLWPLADDPARVRIDVTAGRMTAMEDGE